MAPTTAVSSRLEVLLLTLALVISAGFASFATTAPAAAAPDPDCAEAFPVTDLEAGDVVTGLTVSAGTSPGTFDGEILGVLDSGIAPGLDMIIARLTSPAIDAAGGIWMGMSGSPVYAEDGRLIGAVAYGLAWGTSPVAGITPFEVMRDYLGDAVAPATVPVGAAMARTIAAESDVSPRQAGQGLAQLPMPRGFAGVRAARFAHTTERAYLPHDAYRMGAGSGTAAAGIDTVAAGGNLAAVASVGDITAAGVGTTTSVCGGRVVGFGHPMAFTGETSLALAAANAIYVQEDPLGVPFKVANIGELGGTITDDRLAGIAGNLGATPAGVRFTSEVTYRDRGRVGDTEIFVEDWLADIAFFANIGNHDRVIDGIQAGTETQQWTITGTRRDGSPFTLRYTDRYQSASDVVEPAMFHLPDLLWTLSTFPGVRVTSVTNRAKVSRDSRTYRIAKVQQRVRGNWVDRTSTPVRVKAGNRLRLRVRVVASDGSARHVRYQMRVPKRFAGQVGSLSLVGGNRGWDDFLLTSPNLAALAADLRTRLRNDQVRLRLGIGNGASKLRRERASDPLPLVVNGQRSLRVVVR